MTLQDIQISILDMCGLFLFLYVGLSDSPARGVEVTKMHVLEWAFWRACPCVRPSVCACVSGFQHQDAIIVVVLTAI